MDVMDGRPHIGTPSGGCQNTRTSVLAEFCLVDEAVTRAAGVSWLFFFPLPTPLLSSPMALHSQ